MKLKHIILLAAAMMLSGAMTGCGSRKAATAIASEAGEWHDMVVPVKLSLKSPASFSLSGRATMVRDSVVYMSFRVIGFEAAVLNVTADSAFFVDKYHKYYFAESLDDILGHYRDYIGIGRIQDILLGRSEVEENHTVTFGADGALPVSISYSDYGDACPGKIAQTVTVDATVKDTDIKASVEWSASSARCNTYPEIRFRRPGSSYKRIGIAQAQQIFKNLSL